MEIQQSRPTLLAVFYEQCEQHAMILSTFNCKWTEIDIGTPFTDSFKTK